MTTSPPHKVSPKHIKFLRPLPRIHSCPNSFILFFFARNFVTSCWPKIPSWWLKSGDFGADASLGGACHWRLPSTFTFSVVNATNFCFIHLAIIENSFFLLKKSSFKQFSVRRFFLPFALEFPILRRFFDRNFTRHMSSVHLSPKGRTMHSKLQLFIQLIKVFFVWT